MTMIVKMMTKQHRFHCLIGEGLHKIGGIDYSTPANDTEIQLYIHDSSMTERTPPFHPPPLQYLPSISSLQSRQKPMPPLSYPMTWVECVPRSVTHLYAFYGRVRRNFREEIERGLFGR